MDTSLVVLHVTSAPGGGVDRYVRDIARALPSGHVALHAGQEIDIVENLATGDVIPVQARSAAVAAMLGSSAGAVHVHTIDDESRSRVAALRALRPTPAVLTLHDVSFAQPRAFASAGTLREETSSRASDADWPRTMREFAASMQAVIAPSDFIRDLAAATLPGVITTMISPGIDEVTALPQSLPQDFVEARAQHVVAVVGAIGPHKGSALLADIARGLAAANAVLVVIGYTDTRVQRGWAAPGLYVHGPYIDGALSGWLAAYAPRVVLFPNRLPESFSYTLSEVWSAGIPVIVPDEGALGERVRRHGGGWLLPPAFDAQSAAALVRHVVSDGGARERLQVQSRIVEDGDKVTDLATMTRGIAAVYARFGITPDRLAQRPDLSALAPLIATNVNGMAFRQELVRLCEALDNAERALRAASGEADAQRERAAGLAAWADKLQRDVDDARAWAAKLDQDVATLNGQLAQRDAAMQALNERLATLAADAAALRALPRFAQRALRWKAGRGRD